MTRAATFAKEYGTAALQEIIGRLARRRRLSGQPLAVRFLGYGHDV
jgi:hypothetical protein